MFDSLKKIQIRFTGKESDIRLFLHWLKDKEDDYCYHAVKYDTNGRFYLNRGSNTEGRMYVAVQYDSDILVSEINTLKDEDNVRNDINSDFGEDHYDSGDLGVEQLCLEIFGELPKKG